MRLGAVAVMFAVGCGSDFGLGHTSNDDEPDVAGDGEYGNADEHDWPNGGGWGDPEALPDLYVALTVGGEGESVEVIYVDLRGQVAHRATVVPPDTNAVPITLFGAGPGQVAVQTTGTLNVEANGQGWAQTPDLGQGLNLGYQLSVVHPDDTEAELVLASAGELTTIEALRTGMSWPPVLTATEYVASGMIPGDTEQLLFIASDAPCTSPDVPPMRALPVGYRALHMPAWPSKRWLPEQVAPDHGLAVWSLEGGLVDDRRSVAMLMYHGECTGERIDAGETLAGVWYPESGHVWSRAVPFATRVVRHAPENGGSVLVTTRTSEAAGWRLITEDWRVSGDQNPRVDLSPVGIIDADLGAFILLEQTVDGSSLALYYHGKRVHRIKQLRFGLEKRSFRAHHGVLVPPM